MILVMHPSQLTTLATHCPLAVSLEEAGTPRERDVFHAGTAAHAIIQEIGEQTNRKGRALEYLEMQTVARAVCERLISEGRSFDGKPEPPLPADPVWLGRDLALDYLGPRPLEPGAEYEVGVAVGEDWKPTAYEGEEVGVGGEGGPEPESYVTIWPHFRTILDYVRIEEGDGEAEFEETTVVIRDWKSSWATDADRLNHLQQRAQAVMAWIHYPEASAIRREVVNLRTHATYSDTLYVSFPEVVEQLEEWRDDIDSTLRALEEMKADGIDGLRPASPGAGCVGCPYVGRCEEGREYLLSADGITQHGSDEERAALFAVTVALMGRTRDLLKASGGESVEIENGEVGYIRQPYREAKPGAARLLAEEWGLEDDPRIRKALEALSGAADAMAPDWEGAIAEARKVLSGQGAEERALGLIAAMKPTKTNLENALAVLYPDKQVRTDWLEGQTVEKFKKVFKVVKR